MEVLEMQPVALITGAAKRIGRAIAIAFANGGYRVVAHYNKSREEAEELLAEIGGSSKGHLIIQCDFGKPGEAANLIPALAEEGMLPQCLVNNASCYSRARLADTTPEILQNSMQVNFASPFELMRSFANICKNGCIINITDQRNTFVDPDSGIYAIAKKALENATMAAALDWAPCIRVNAVAPGIVLPPPGKSWEGMQHIIPQIPMKRRSTEEDVANACIFLATQGNITGQTIYIDGGLHLMGHPIETKKP